MPTVINRDVLKFYVEKGLVSEKKHPSENLWIYNYTKRCQYDDIWDDVIMDCRGLILDNEKIVARPFRKFFNYEEFIRKGFTIPKEDFDVYEKLDGSLGILYQINGTPFIATRGSFNSEQALKGCKILWEQYKGYGFNEDYTYLFEIIYPENKIVVDYGDKEELILLGVFNTKTGEEIRPLDQFNAFKTALLYDGIRDAFLRIEHLKSLEQNNKEGFVVRFRSGLRVKVKFDEYIRLHKIVTMTNSKLIWEHLKDKKPFGELIDRVPDELDRKAHV